MPTLQGKYKVPHFDAKGEANAIFTELGVPTTFLLTSFYWDNLIHFGMGPKKGADGKLAFTLPMGDKKLPGIAAEDIGRCAYGDLQARPRAHRQDRRHRRRAPDRRADGRRAQQGARPGGRLQRRARPRSTAASASPAPTTSGNMFQFKRDFEKDFCAARDLGFSRSLNPKLQTFAQWLAANKERIPLG